MPLGGWGEFAFELKSIKKVSCGKAVARSGADSGTSPESSLCRENVCRLGSLHHDEFNIRQFVWNHRIELMLHWRESGWLE